MNQSDYWVECLSSSFEEHGIVATAEQIRTIADDVKVGCEYMDMAFHVPESPLVGELERTKRELERERSKVVCPECGGRGTTRVAFGDREAISSCFHCGGEGYHIPR